MKPTKLTIFLLFILSAVSLQVQAQKVANEISGMVTDGQSPLSNATITIKGSEKGTATDSKGKYSMKANPRDVLVYSYIGMKPVEIVVEDVTRILNISLWPKIEELDEVVVTKSKRKTQKDLKLEYAINRSIVKSNFGFIDKETTPFKFRALDGNDISPAAIDLVAAIAGKFSDVTGRSWYDQSTGQTEPAMFVRGGKLVYEVDGMFMTKVPEINLSIIDRVGIVYGTAAARRYGNNAGGVMIINTKMVKYGVSEDDGRAYDRAKLRNNIFDKNSIIKYGSLRSEPQYLQELQKAENFDKAKELYQTHYKNYASSYSFLLDAFQFFETNYKKHDFSDAIITDNWSSFENNPMALKALGYVHQSNGDLQKANAIYKDVFLLRPSYGQSYLDLANSYRELKAYKKSIALYTRYDHLIRSELVKKDTSWFFEIFEREFDNLVVLKADEIISDKAYKNNRLEEDFSGARLVFEWNDGEAEFELQFVNPQGHYFKEEHSLFANATEIQQEKQLGYSCKEFLMDDSLPGVWQINAKYLGNRKLTASYLKATIYYNYGLESQRKETKVFKLGLKNVNQELFKINIEPSLSTK